MNHKQCQYCGKPLANYKDFDDIEDGEGEHLCWARFDRCLVGPEIGAETLRAEVDRLTSIINRLESEIASIRPDLTKQPDRD